MFTSHLRLPLLPQLRHIKCIRSKHRRNARIRRNLQRVNIASWQPPHNRVKDADTRIEDNY